MKYTKKVLRFFRILLFACMFSVCMILGVVPIIPKRDEKPEIEIVEIEEKDNSDNERESKRR